MKHPSCHPLFATGLLLAALIPTTACKFKTQSSAKIAGGTVDYTHLTASVALRRFNKDKQLGPCTGTVVSPTLVLTAAHCLGDDIVKVEGAFDAESGPAAVAKEWRRHPDAGGIPDKVQTIYDAAFITFEAGSIAGATVAKFAAKPVEVDDLVKFVGYGFDSIEWDPNGSANYSGLGKRRFGIMTVRTISTQSQLLYFDWREWQQDQAHLGGDSGAGLYNSDDELIGIVHGGNKYSKGEVADTDVNIHSKLIGAFIKESIPSFVPMMPNGKPWVY